MFLIPFLSSDFQGRARWDFSATCVSTPATVSTERPVIPSPGNASRTASSGGAGNPPVRYVGRLSKKIFKNHIEKLMMKFCLNTKERLFFFKLVPYNNSSSDWDIIF